MRKVPQPKSSIVFLDAGTLDFSDLSLQPLENLGSFKSYSWTPPEKTAVRIRRASQVIVNKCVLTRRDLELARNLKVIHVAATGVNNVDLEAARQLGISVTNVAGYSTESVVQLTLAFLLSLAVNLVPYQDALKKGQWSRSRFFMWPGFPVMEICGKKLGIIGYGHIGKRVGEVARSFGLEVLTARIPGRPYSAKNSRLSLTQVLKQADFVTIHAPLTPLTRSLIGERELRTMKRSAFLINMARGGIVDEKALLKALREKWIAGAALDVLEHEPPKVSEPLLKQPNLIAMPHMGWASLESRRRLLAEVILNIKAFSAGRKRNRVV